METQFATVWLKKRKKFNVVQLFIDFQKKVKIERNSIREVKEFSIAVDEYVAMKYANSHQRGLKGS